MTRNLDLALNALAAELGTTAPRSGSLTAGRTPTEIHARIETLMGIIDNLTTDLLGPTRNPASLQIDFARRALADQAPDAARMHLVQAVTKLQRHIAKAN